MKTVTFVVSNDELRIFRRLRKKLAERIARNVHRADEEAQLLYRLSGEIVREGEQQEA